MNIPNKQFKNFLSFFKESPGRLTKYVELLTLKEKSTPYATTDRKSLREVGIVINTKCNLNCVWCHREEQHIKDSGYLERNGNLKNKYKNLFSLEKTPYLNTEFLAFNVSKCSQVNSILALSNVRKALNYGFDRFEMVKYLRKNMVFPASSGIVPIFYLSIN